ncbi:MAG: hypothetical protein NC826_02845 [Candidatus Omnitrophica bacterium]|nr:hypothetical protein [Candidatus Omnitrophota bacterium]
MDLKKFLFIFIMITFIALFYIHHQSRIFYLAYKNEQKKKILDELIDKNNTLRYNISSFFSLIYLDKNALKYVEFEIPKENKIIKLSSLNNIKSNESIKNKSNLVLRVFDRVTKSAEANTLRP